MNHSLSTMIVPTMKGGLLSLENLLNKAESHVIEHKHDASVYLGARLFPNMFPLAKQVQMATDLPRRGLERLLGKTPSSVDDNESTFDELTARIKATLAPWESCDTEALDQANDKIVSVPMGREKSRDMAGGVYATSFLLPNFYFHITTVYNLLRANGVPLGKRDYLASFIQIHN